KLNTWPIASTMPRLKRTV
ncbi:hypothetical protein D030_5016B, partial [Vibrio parahaemolyticus AQ3810]